MVIAVSGGIDSITLMYKEALAGGQTTAVFCDFGQPSSDAQKEVILHHIEVLKQRGKKVGFFTQHIYLPPMFIEGAPFERSRPKNPYPSAEHVLEKTDWSHDDSLDNFAILPGKNSLLLLYTAMVAAEVEASPVVSAGYQLEPQQWDHLDEVGGDCHPQVFDDIKRLLRRAFDKPVDLSLPFMDKKMTKDEVIHLAKSMEVDLHQTYSCEFAARCGACYQCLTVKSAFLRCKIHRNLTAT